MTITKYVLEEGAKNKRNYLDISTGHVTEKDFEIITELCNGSTLSSLCMSYEYGAWVHVSDDPEYLKESIADARKIGLSEAFITCLNLGHELGCFWIKFDNCADFVDGLETFDW